MAVDQHGWYSGYCPQFKYNLGKTYGQLTGQLLTSPNIKRSRHLVLQSGPSPSPNHRPLEHPQDPVRRKRQLGDQRLTISMIPGYTGFIPRSQKFFAKTYTETSRDAMSDFVNEQLLQEAQRQEVALMSKLQEQHNIESVVCHV
ncbi:hypothetical protein GDO86_012119 [Hymenochirus boettgeri]|uniref:Ciliary microtubule inner protein 2B n=1 Tax=Hymenochirus boettgeri TaxID=247094 RepID=A0A8T2JLW5_9PIPI|nr:hypothetical protein GDO86_012119 [Hymenochirus boettgeri]